MCTTTYAATPDGVAVLVSAELCSLNFGALEADIAGLVGTALFADGAAAVVAVGERRAEKLGITGPRIVDSASRLYPDSLRTMGVGRRRLRVPARAVPGGSRYGQPLPA